MKRSVPVSDSPRFTRPPQEAYTPEDDPAYARHQLVNNAITTRLTNRLSGRGEEASLLYGSQPSNQFFAGALVSQYEFREAQEEDDTFQNFAQDIAPFTIGFRFRIPATIDDEAKIELSPHAVGFQRRFPTFEEQREHANDNEEADILYEQEESVRNDSVTGTEIENDGGNQSNKVDVSGSSNSVVEGGSEAHSVDEPVDSESQYQELVRVYKRIPFEWDTTILTGEEVKSLADSPTSDSFSLDTEHVKESAQDIPRRFRNRTSGVGETEANSVPVAVLQNEATFENYLDEMFGGDEYEPLWDAELEIDAQRESAPASEDHYITVTVRLINTHGENYVDSEDPDYEDWRNTLFDVGIKADVGAENLETFESKEIEDEYQYDGTIHGVGENCAVEPIYSEGSGTTADSSPEAIGVRTETIPTYEQAKYLSRDPEDIKARMETLAGNEGREAVFEVLTRIADTMDEAADDYEDIKHEITASKTGTARENFEEAVEQFEQEQHRFRAGMQCLRDDKRAYRAFTLCNQAFANMGFSQWRLFQIVFIVMCLPDILKQADGIEDDVEVDFESDALTEQLDVADIIYFPTGGGKTEAYLGLVTFTAFHDRLRGKDYGMTAFTKFPLRFLSLQQLQRVANVFAEAELLRRKHELGGEEFSLGYLVGKQNTPNALKEDGQNKLRRAVQDEEFKEEILYVDTCPFCGEEQVEITGDRERGRIIHQCTNGACSEDELPVYVTDREVYRYAPTFVVSTIDKISIIGMQRRMRTLFGQAKIRCEKHGYAGESECVADQYALLSDGACSEDDWENVDPVEPPSLLIQDELHLLREEFGAFDSHYETFIQAYNDRITEGDWTMKVVAATATIEGADQQVRALYQKNANIFPSKSPRLKQSFYAYADPIRTQRRMIGAIPRSISRTYAIEKIHEEYARTIQEFRATPDELYSLIQEVTDDYDVEDASIPADKTERDAVLQDILDDYEVQISYHYSKDNTDLLMRVLRTMINQHLNDDGEPYSALSGELLTGETGLGHVRDILRRLLNYDDKDVNPVHMLIATSMISHGVDIDRLNFIGFFGLPRQTAEYIQSYSRVGRKWPGTVFLLHNPRRVRDRTYYTRFQYYQEYQDLLVEATPLERWAEFAIECTMPGVFCAALLQYYDFELEENGRNVYMFDDFEKAAQNGEITYDDALQFVKDAYGVRDEDGSDDTRSGIELYRQQIEQEFKRLWDACLDTENRISDSRAHNPDTDENNFIPVGVLGRAENVRRPMRNLRDIDEQITIAPDKDTSIIINEYRHR